MPFVVQKEKDILLELVIETNNLLVEARAFGDRGKLAEKWQETVAAINACWVAFRTADTCKKATGHKEECTRLTTDLHFKVPAGDFQKF